MSSITQQMARRMKELLQESANPWEDMVEVARLLEEDLNLPGLDLRSQESFIRSLFQEEPASRILGKLALRYNLDPALAENPVDLIHGLLQGE